MRCFLRYRLLFLLLPAVFVAWSTVAPAASGDAPFVVQVPPRQILPEEQLPAHVKVVAGMLADRLRGGRTPLPAGASFGPGAANAVQEAGFNYKDFGFVGLDFLHYKENPQDGGGAVGMVGVFHFSDGLGRSADAVFTVQYVLTPKELTVRKAEVRPVSSLFPRVLCFYVPRAAYAGAAGGLTSFVAWLDFALKHAVRMTSDSEDAARHKQWADAPEAEKAALADATWPLRPYVALVFLMDRVLPPGKLRLGLSKGPGGKTKFINYSGWQIGVMEADLALDHPGASLDVQLDYTPDAALLPKGAKKTYPIGIFSTRKNSAP